MTEHTPASDDDITRSVNTVHTQLFARLRKPAKRPVLRGFTAALAAVALFGGGLAVGAAAYAAPGNSSMPPSASAVPFPPTAGPSEFAFAIDCYTGPDPGQVFIGLGFNKTNDPTGLLVATARANPTAACNAQQIVYAQGKNYGQVIGDLLINGSNDCLVLNMPGAGPVYAWVSSGTQNVPFWEHQPAPGDIRSNASSTDKPSGYPNNCEQVAVPAPTVATPPLGACAVDVQHANVYILGSQTAEEVCAANGYPVWTS